MSHYTRASTRFTDAALLIEALARMGFPEVEYHDSPVSLYGYRGDVRPDRANVVIRRRHIGAASNDIGFVRTPSGEFQAIISEFDARKFDSQWMSRLAMEFAKVTVDQFAEQNGWLPSGAPEVEEDGTMRLVLRRTS